MDNSYDRVNWMAKYLKIMTMEGNIEPLVLNDAQLKVHNTLELQRKAGLPMRIIVLKARREGVSTYSEARFFSEINFKQNRIACICSADLESSHKVFRMTKLFQDSLPKSMKRGTDYSNRNEISYAAPHRSVFAVQTAGKDVLGRGGLVHYFHPTEFAFWDKAKEQFGGAVQEVPDSPDTIVIIESTANGVGGAFYDMYMQAEQDFRQSKDLGNYLPVFLPWYGFLNYQKNVPAGFEIGKAHSSGYPDDWLSPEQELVDRFRCIPEQLMWRRWAIKNKCQGDLSLFKQEYPGSVQEAFQSTGRPVFSHAMLDRQTKVAALSGRYCHFIDRELIPTEGTFNNFKVCRTVQRGHQYSIGIDTMEGKLVDQNDPKSEGDRHGVVVFDRNDLTPVCIYQGAGSQSELAKRVIECGKYYNDAYLCPEVNNGMEFLSVLKESGYENIYTRKKDTDKWSDKDSENLGWKTTAVTRAWLVNSFITFVNEGHTILFPEIIKEMRTFIYDKQGKAVHASGKWDDLLFAYMLSVRCHLDCPLDAVAYQFGGTDDGPPEKRPMSYDLAMASAIDPGVFFEEEDECMYTE